VPPGLPQPNTVGGLFIDETDVNGGSMVIATDSAIASMSSVTNNVRVKFDDVSGNTGAWFLEQNSTGYNPSHTAQAFAGTTAIEGFAGGGGSSDEIDISQLSFLSAAKNGHSAVNWNQVVSGVGGFGTLELTDGQNANTKLDITLIGNYATSDFQIASNGAGGTVVTTTSSLNQETFAL
jgi:hypothetical protein